VTRGAVTGRDLASAVAVELQTGLTADCTQLGVDLAKRQLEMIRPAYGGNIMATVLCERHRPQMATVRPRVMPMPARQPGRTGRIVREDFRLKEAEIATKILQLTPAAMEGMNLAEAEIIVAAGRGIGSAENLRVVEELASALGGMVGASRAIVDQGWASRSCQVGQTGKTVRPRLYVAVGISGAISAMMPFSILTSSLPHFPCGLTSIPFFISNFMLRSSCSVRTAAPCAPPRRSSPVRGSPTDSRQREP
jgi:electron transfer flavoprotein alpha subunit